MIIVVYIIITLNVYYLVIIRFNDDTYFGYQIVELNRVQSSSVTACVHQLRNTQSLFLILNNMQLYIYETINLIHLIETSELLQSALPQ